MIPPLYYKCDWFCLVEGMFTQEGDFCIRSKVYDPNNQPTSIRKLHIFSEPLKHWYRVCRYPAFEQYPLPSIHLANGWLLCEAGCSTPSKYKLNIESIDCHTSENGTRKVPKMGQKSQLYAQFLFKFIFNLPTLRMTSWENSAQGIQFCQTKLFIK